MDRFSVLNPKVTFLFFVLIILLTLLLFNPVFLAVSLCAALMYSLILQGANALRRFFGFILPLIVLVAVFNMFFVNVGATPLFVIKSREFTLEALFYGLCQGVLFADVIMWVSCYCEVMKDDRFLAVLSRVAPKLSLVFSMTLSFIPRLRKNAREIQEARQNIDLDEPKLKRAAKGFSALVSLTLEEGMELASSMTARGYCSDRTFYSKFRFSPTDAAVTALSLVLFCTVLAYRITGRTAFTYEPHIVFENISALCVTAFALFAFLPVIYDLTEGIKWHCLKQRA